MQDASIWHLVTSLGIYKIHFLKVMNFDIQSINIAADNYWQCKDIEE